MLYLKCLRQNEVQADLGLRVSVRSAVSAISSCAVKTRRVFQTSFSASLGGQPETGMEKKICCVGYSDKTDLVWALAALRLWHHGFFLGIVFHPQIRVYVIVACSLLQFWQVE